jgi:hypothetical protein
MRAVRRGGSRLRTGAAGVLRCQPVRVGHRYRSAVAGIRRRADTRPATRHRPVGDVAGPLVHACLAQALAHHDAQAPLAAPPVG